MADNISIQKHVGLQEYIGNRHVLLLGQRPAAGPLARLDDLHKLFRFLRSTARPTATLATAASQGAAMPVMATATAMRMTAAARPGRGYSFD